MSILSRIFDERFLAHRQRSTSTAGITCSVLSLLLFEYRLVMNHVASWDLLAVGGTFLVVKLSLMAYYAMRD